MALFFPDDESYDLSRRMRGFNRYRQLMSFYAMRWIKLNLLTVLGAVPLVLGITFALQASSSALLLPFSILGGMIFGPFLAGLFDSIMRGLRDAPGRLWPLYRKSWKQNWKGSLLPGAVLGLFVGLVSFMILLFWNARIFPGWGTIALYAFSILLFLMIFTLYWPQLVLFSQSPVIRLKNCVMFIVKHFRKMLLVSVLELLHIAVYVLIAPWTFLLIPFIGLWYILFVCELILYADFNEDFQVEAQYIPIEGDPWAEPEPQEEGD